MGKAKQVDTQIVELNTKNIPKEVTDPTSGKKIKVTQDMVATLVGAERQITGGLEQVALGLHTIKKEKLFLLYGLDGMDEYLDQRFQFSPRFGYSLMKYADVFGDSKNFAEIMRQPRKLLELAADNDDLKQQLKDGEVTMPDGTMVTLKELTKSMALQMTTDLDIAKKDLKAEKKKARDLQQQLEEKSKMVDHYESGMADGDFKRLTQKKEILSELFATEAQVAEIIKRLDSIESEEPEVVARLEAVLTSLLAGASQVQSKWMHLLLSTQPDQH